MKNVDREYMSRFYDQIYQDRPDVGFYLELVRRLEPRHVLECGCGTGRITIPLAAAGVFVDGIDISRERLELMEGKLQQVLPEHRERIQLAHGDMRISEQPRSYDLVIMPFRTFQHLLTVSDQILALENLKRHLLPNGRILIDIFNPSIPWLAAEVTGIPWQESEVLLPNSARCLFLQRIIARDWHAQTQDSEEIFEITDSLSSRTHTLRWQYTTRYTFRWEMEHLLERVGFKVETTWGNYDFTPFGDIYPGEILMLARLP